MRMTAKQILCAALCGLLLGCDGAAPRKTGVVSGKVQLDGEPVSDVMVTFENAEEGFGASTAVTNGAYRFETPLVVGNYLVAIQPPPPPPPTAGPPPDATDQPESLKKYMAAAQSGLSADVQEGNNTFDFELEP